MFDPSNRLRPWASSIRHGEAPPRRPTDRSPSRSRGRASPFGPQNSPALCGSRPRMTQCFAQRRPKAARQESGVARKANPPQRSKALVRHRSGAGAVQGARSLWPTVDQEGLDRSLWERLNVRAKRMPTAWRARQQAQNGAKPQRLMASAPRFCTPLERGIRHRFSHVP